MEIKRKGKATTDAWRISKGQGKSDEKIKEKEKKKKEE